MAIERHGFGPILRRRIRRRATRSLADSHIYRQRFLQPLLLESSRRGCGRNAI